MAEPGSSLNILEVGGGTGTLARDVLDHLRAAVPASYAQCSYTSVEISPQLADVQKRTVSKTAGHGSHHQVQSKTSSFSRCDSAAMHAESKSSSADSKGFCSEHLSACCHVCSNMCVVSNTLKALSPDKYMRSDW